MALFLDFDGNSNSYSASALKNWPPKDDEWNSLRYDIALISISAGRQNISFRSSGSDPVTFTGTVPVGTYNIVIEAYSDNEIYARGSTSTTVKLGRNNAPVTMHRAGIYELDIEILPKEIELLQGGSYTFTAIPSYGLEYRDDFANSTNPYEWSVSGSKSTISGSGNSATLFVGSDETASTLTVTVECATNNSTKPGTAKVAVKDLINAQTPVIRFQPNDKDYILGGPATLSVVVNPLTDGGDLTYQWFSSAENKNSGGTAISGETEADYNPDTTLAGTYYYYVEITNTNTSSNVNGNKTAMVTSRAAKVTVIVLVDAEKPVITSDPQAGTYSIGKPAILSVVVETSTDNGGLSYQWYRNADNNYGGEKISGATGSNYIPPTDTIGTIYYYVVVTNTNNSINGKKIGETVSKTAKVTVNDLVNAVVPNITKQPTGKTYVEGDIATPLTIEASVSDGGSLSYQWYSNTSPNNTGGSSIGGATGASYKPSNNSAGTFYYYVLVTNTIPDNKDGGQKTASTISNPVTVTFNAKVNAMAPAINTQPQGGTFNFGASVTLSVGASVTDGGNLTYQWYSNTSPINTGGSSIGGATGASYSPPTNNAGTLYYYVIVTNTITNNGDGGQKTASTTSNPVTVIFNDKVNAMAPAITTQPQGGTFDFGASVTLSVGASVTGGGNLTYQWYSNTSPINTGGSSIGGATSASYNPPNNSAGTLYYYVIVTNTIANNGDGGEKTASTTSNPVTVTFNAKVNAMEPAINTQPQGGTFNFGASVTLSVGASVTDGGNLTYQWYSNTSPINTGGSSIGGATGASYNPPNNSAGTFYYYVIIINTITNNGDGGQKTASTTSNPVTVIFNDKVNALTPTIITQPQGGTFTIGASVTLSVGASVTDGGNLTYQWYSNTSPINTGGSSIGGATGASYNPPNNSAGTFYYYVIVTNTITNNGDGGQKTASTTSNTVTVTSQYIVTFDGNGATSGTTPTAQPVNYGSSVTLPTQGSLSKTGYTFDGWNTLTNGTGTNYIANSSYTPTGNITLYAKWTPKSVAITLNSNGGGNGSVTSISGKVYDGTVGSDLPISSPYIPTRSDHIFMGWSTTGGTTNTVNFISGTVINTINGVTGADGASPTLTLYAVWKSVPIFTIIFADIIDQAPEITGPAISRSGTGNSTTATITVPNPGEYASFKWYIDGFDTTITTSSITLDATNNTYNGVGVHYLTLEVVKGGIQYNKTITFTVTN